MISLDRDKLFFDIERCCQCGTCLAACILRALFPVLKHNGLYEIKRDEGKCVECGACENVCPARSLPQHIFSQEDWNGFSALYRGRSTSPETARMASSGGVARTFIKAALESSYAEKAYCLVKTDKYPWAEGRYLAAPIDMSIISNSMYLPILVNANLKKEKKKASLLLIGTPCQLSGAGLFFQKQPVDLIKIALLCKQQKTFQFTKFIGGRLGVLVDEKTHVRYRGDGWPGSMSIGTKKITWADAASLPYGKKMWMVPGCRFCGDLFGHNADISLSDPWGLTENTESGSNLIWVRTAKGMNFLNCLRDSLHLEEMDLHGGEITKLVDWNQYKRKQALIPYYLGQHLPFPNGCLAKLADRQRRLYEGLLSSVTMPSIALKIMQRFPFADDLIKS